MITYCFFLRDMLEPQVPQERRVNEEQEYVPPLLSAFCLIFLYSQHHFEECSITF